MIPTKPVPRTDPAPVDARPQFKTARQELDDALQGMAPALAGYVDAQLPNAKVHELADAIGRAVHVAARRHAAALFADARDYLETLWTTVGLAEAVERETPEPPGPYEHRGAYSAPEVRS